MEEAAAKLPPHFTGESSGDAVSLWYLTGKRFWYQTAFCAWTFAKQSRRHVVLNLVDDGSLDSSHEAALRKLFPEGATITKKEIEGKIDALLPRKDFPILRLRWNDYVNIRKLIDIHLGSTGIKLVLDSDMLFFREPTALLEWWDSNSATLPVESPLSAPCLMMDCAESYGYSRSVMEGLTGVPIPALLNVGICGLRSEELDWKELEHWCQVLLDREGKSYYLEQALVAMLATKKAPVVMPRSDYVTFPSHRQTTNGEGVLQHYVADSKPWYFKDAWKKAMNSPQA